MFKNMLCEGIKSLKNENSVICKVSKDCTKKVTRKNRTYHCEYEGKSLGDEFTVFGSGADKLAVEWLYSHLKLIDLQEGCSVCSANWYSRIKKVQEENVKDFIFYADELGEHTLSDFLNSFEDKEAVRKEIIENLSFYARFDTPSMYCILKGKGFKPSK